MFRQAAQSRQGHAAILCSQYPSTASSAQKVTDTSIEPGFQVNGSTNSSSGAFSLDRKNRTWKWPDVAAQRDASTHRVADHVRSIVSRSVGENRTSLKPMTGLQTGAPSALIWAKLIPSSAVSDSGKEK